MKVLGLSLASFLILSAHNSMAGRDKHCEHADDTSSISTEKDHSFTLKRKLNGNIKDDEGAISQKDKKARTEKKIPLKKHIARFQQEIEDARKEANVKKIRELYETFQQIHYSDRTWRNLALTLKIYRWPSQENWKEVVGGHLFFPKDILDWEERTSSPYYGYLAKRIDTIWSLSVGAKFHHALSKFYLGRVLLEVFGAFTDAEKPPFLDRLFKEAFADLIQCEDNPDVCFVIGSNNEPPYFISSDYVDESFTEFKKREIRLYKKGGDVRNRFAFLKLRRWDKIDFDDNPPTFEEFWALGEQGYMPAYLEAIHSKEDKSEKLAFLKKIAKEKGYAPAWKEIGYLYKTKGDIEKARKSYLKAARAGLSESYISLGRTYVGDIDLISPEYKKNLKTLPQRYINQAIKYFTSQVSLKIKTAGNILLSFILH